MKILKSLNLSLALVVALLFAPALAQTQQTADDKDAYIDLLEQRIIELKQQITGLKSQLAAGESPADQSAADEINAVQRPSGGIVPE